MEYDRGSSRSPTVRRSVSDWPARKAYWPASSPGTSKVTATASSQSRSTAATLRRWNPPRAGVLVLTVTSDLLDVFEGLAAGTAAPQGLAGGRAEPRGLLRVRRAAQRAAHRAYGRAEREGDRARRGHRRPVRRGDAGLGELAPALGADPVGGPRRVQRGTDLDAVMAGGAQGADQ